MEEEDESRSGIIISLLSASSVFFSLSLCHAFSLGEYMSASGMMSGCSSINVQIEEGVL
jgi:hypothetical protein